MKVPLFVQGGIHGNEYEGVDAAMQVIERLALTPYGTDPEVDQILDQAIIVFNPIQNPDGRIVGRSPKTGTGSTSTATSSRSRSRKSRARSHSSRSGCPRNCSISTAT